MRAFYINGGKKLNGEIDLYPAKNALLPILAGSLITEQEVVIKNCCKFSDVLYMVDILEHLGAQAHFVDNDLYLNLKTTSSYSVPEEQTKKVRSSIFMLGSLLSRFKHAKVSYPGGCNIGTRPIDLHLKGLKSLNVKIVEEDGYIICDGEKMESGVVKFDFPSVGATENVMMASVLLKGTTTIINPAREPEIVDLQNFLNSMGAKISGAGTGVITVEGVEKLHGTIYTPITDRIVTGTYVLAGIIAGGKIKLNNVVPEHNQALFKLLKQSGANIKLGKDWISVSINKRPHSIKLIETNPYPAFATDLQSPILTLQTISSGTSVVIENLYETRFKVVPELVKMGANITIKDRVAKIKGVKQLNGIVTHAPDLRSGAGLVMAGLVAQESTTIKDIENIERGYLHFDEDLRKLGADITTIEID